ncbi:unnamed protein product [Gongylonema pulchrum]|uniref:Uncharacterized protein n=1 Tax=Gongylonema pulchrum TaxID=637853 RepID=A0A183EP58_9BILA|nr:unnamed protein product [Gongylonema pulchrum]
MIESQFYPDANRVENWPSSSTSAPMPSGDRVIQLTSPSAAFMTLRAQSVGTESSSSLVTCTPAGVSLSQVNSSDSRLSCDHMLI